MAYVNLINQAVADKAESFCRIRDFICKRNGTYDYSSTGIGWTLWDSSYAVDEDNPASGDWFVIRSTGESGDEVLYFQISWVTNGFMVKGYLSWNPTAHAGSTSYYYNTTGYLDHHDTDVNNYLFIYGDLDFVFIATDTYSTTMYHVFHFGKLLPTSPNISTDIATCSTTLTAGSDVSIVVDAVPSSWEVGSEVMIFTTHTDDMATVKMEVITIKTLVGTTITADLTNSYTTGCKLTHFLGYICQGNTQFMSTCYTLMNAVGSVNQACNSYLTTISTSISDPSGFESRYVLQPIINQETIQGWPLSLYEYVKVYNVSGLTILDTFEDMGGNIWRYLMAYSNKYIMVKEV